MLGSISPVGEAARRQRWWLTATAYVVASVTGGVAIGAVSGGVGQLLLTAVAPAAPARIAAVAVVVAAAALFDARILPWRLPTWHRQVDERWLTTYRGWVYGAGFGLQLGLGVVTIVPSAVIYAMLAAAALTGSWALGAAIGGVFGLVRAVPLLLAGTLRSTARLHSVTGAVAASEAGVHRTVIGAQALLAAVAGAVALLGITGATG